MAEDYSVAFGFDQLATDSHLSDTVTIGQEFQINYLSDKIRLLVAQNNYTEVATFSLCSKVGGKTTGRKLWGIVICSISNVLLSAEVYCFKEEYSIG